MSIRIENTITSSFVKWFSELLCMSEDFEDSDLSMIVCLLWFIWKERNAVLFHGREPNPFSVLHQVRRSVGELQLAPFDSPLVAIRNMDNFSKKWQPPGSSWLKINCDGSFLSEDKSAAIGLICRDHHGSFQWGFGERVWASSAFLSEVLAIRKAILICMELHITRVQIETDNLNLFRCLTSGSLHTGEWESLNYLEEILKFAESRSDLLFSFTLREGNYAADHLAVSVRKTVYPTGWVETPTLSMLSIMSCDTADEGTSVHASETIETFHDREGIG